MRRKSLQYLVVRDSCLAFSCSAYCHHLAVCAASVYIGINHALIFIYIIIYESKISACNAVTCKLLGYTVMRPVILACNYKPCRILIYAMHYTGAKCSVYAA